MSNGSIGKERVKRTRSRLKRLSKRKYKYTAKEVLLIALYSLGEDRPKGSIWHARSCRRCDLRTLLLTAAPEKFSTTARVDAVVAAAVKEGLAIIPCFLPSYPEREHIALRVKGKNQVESLL